MSIDITERPDDMAAPANPDDPFLVVENLTVKFPTHDGLVQAVTDLSYTVERGKTLGIVGESGLGQVACRRWRCSVCTTRSTPGCRARSASTASR